MNPFACLEYACWALILAVPLAFGAYWLCTHLRRVARVLAEAGPWLVSRVLHPWSLRGRRLPLMDPHHPSVRAASARGWSPLSKREAREFAALIDLYDAGAEAPEPHYRTPGGTA